MKRNIGHLVLTVADITRAAKFYSILFDIEITPNNSSFDLSKAGLDIFFVQYGKKSTDIFNEKRVGLDHFSIVADKEELPTWLQKIIKAWKGIDSTVLDGKTVGIEKCQYTGVDYICFRDPDNIQIEFYPN